MANALQQEQLSGLYPGNPKRATARPTTEQLLAAFCEITLLGYWQAQPNLRPPQFPVATATADFGFTQFWQEEIYPQLVPKMVKPP